VSAGMDLEMGDQSDQVEYGYGTLRFHLDLIQMECILKVFKFN
jgi:hypothetical protein